MRRMVIAFVFALAISRAQAQPPSPPAQASEAGFSNLVFDEEFQGPLDIGFGNPGHKWNAGLWWDKVPPPCAIHLSNGILTITGSVNNHTDLCTQYHDASGGTYFLGGYFEARIRCTDWSAFWLFCADRPFVWDGLVLASNPLTWTNEIDIIETDPQTPTTAYLTLHKNTSGDAGVPDQFREPHIIPTPFTLVGQWHTYGLLWTQAAIIWYIDNQEITSAPPFLSTWQPVQLILTASPGGVNGGASNVLPPTSQVRWVRVWEK